jgi:hypothetical protein
MANALAITLRESAPETAPGSGDAVALEGRSCVKLALVVTDIVGSLSVSVQTAPSEDGPWRPVATFQTILAAGKASMVVADLDTHVRASWTVSDEATFSVAGQAHQLYAEPSDIATTSMVATAIGDIDDATLAECCLRATADAESALNSSFELPITAWGEDLRGHVADRAVFYAVNARGYNPSSEGDRLIALAGGFMTIDGVRSAAQQYFGDVAKGVIKPVGIIDATPDIYEGAGFVISGPPRR